MLALVYRQFETEPYGIIRDFIPDYDTFVVRCSERNTKLPGRCEKES